MIKGFWAHILRPLVGLAPMDGVTNAPFRLLTAQHGRPDVIFTEFVPTAGLMHGAVRLLTDFFYADAERPVVAQIYGNDPQECYAVAHIVCELGFDGIDINMGCPAKNVAARGAGAGLIRTPQVAQAMIRATQRGVQDWCAGQSLQHVGVPSSVMREIHAMNTRMDRVVPRERVPIPVTVKTRLGYDTVVITDWVKVLLDAEPVAISLHGRTLKQMYQGSADWEAIARAAEIVRQTETLVFGNGDLHDPPTLVQRVCESGVDGVLIGRAAIGNPWIFRATEWVRAVCNGRHVADLPILHTPREQLDAFVAHAELVETLCPPHAFKQLFRFAKPYTTGFHGAAEIRQQIYHVTSSQQLRTVLTPLYQQLDARSSDAPTSSQNPAERLLAGASEERSRTVQPQG